ncbi:MAG TPA: hypothetical protein VK886_09000 [Vicinamibacterales bacterium]|nr:hypothetical protein [Vicinamibacterales bacterium]
MANVPSAGKLVIAAAAAVAVSLVSATAQETGNKSGALAKELAQLMEKSQLDSVAAALPSPEDAFVAAMFIPGELMVVSARYSAPSLLREKIMKKEYREVYVDLNSAATPKTRVFIEDLNTDGLVAEPSENFGFDTFESSDGRMSFDGEWKKQKLSEDDYRKRFAKADEQYTTMLTALLSQLKKPATE